MVSRNAPTPDLTPLSDSGERALPSLSRYRVVEEVGSGGMGRVLEAQDGNLLREVAMKVMRGGNEVDAGRFAIEAQITGQLDHPNVLPVYDYGRDKAGNPYFTMKLIRGHTTLGDLMDMIRISDPRARQWTFRKRVMLVQEVCRALHYAHVRGVVHRDIKPENIVLGAYGEVYLVDWGVALTGADAQIRPVRVDESVAKHVRTSEQELIVGTPAYMSPEHIVGKQADASDDVYSLCAVLFEFLTLRHYLITPPEDLNELARWVVKGKRHSAESFVDPLSGRVPRTLSRVCAKGLDRERDKRYASATELETSLQLWLEGKNPIVCPGTCMQRTMNESRDLIDQHPVAVPAIVITLSVLAIAWLGYASWFTLAH